MSTDDTTTTAAGEVDHSAHLAAAEGALVRVDDITAGYLPGINILNSCDLYCQQGEIVGIIGPNGSGKTSLTAALTGRRDEALRLARQAVASGCDRRAALREVAAGFGLGRRQVYDMLLGTKAESEELE